MSDTNTLTRDNSTVPIENYTGGVFSDPLTKDKVTNHVVSVVGWGQDAEGTPYWHVRNRYAKPHHQQP